MIKKADGSYEGMAIDIYKRVKYELLKEGVSLQLTLEEADSYGSQLPSGHWTGVIGRLTRRQRRHVSRLILRRSKMFFFR